jgi:hypothetical protein
LRLSKRGGTIMRIPKSVFAILAMAVVILLAGHPVVQAGEGLDMWGTDPGAKGDRLSGTLTIYYEQTGAPCCDGDTGVRMYFFLRLYEKKTNEWHIITAVDENPPPGGHCLVLDVDSGLQRLALQAFFDEKVLPQLEQSYTSIALKEVKNDYHNYTQGIMEDPICVIADITLVAQ